MNVREPAVSGSFYPSDARELREQVATFMRAADADHPAPKAIIAPHAGYIYSGPVAGSAYAPLKALRDQIRKVILLGPAHRVYVRGLAASSADFFSTPLGDVPLDCNTVTELVQRFPFVHVIDQAHAPEHSLEVHLPFLQEILDTFSLVPLVVGDASTSEVEQVLEYLWGDAETLIVISSDLSHYRDYDTAAAMDRKASEAIEHLDPGQLHPEQACGHVPVCGLLEAARKHGLRAETIDLRNSGDTASPRDQVVGYGAYIFY